MVTGAQYIVEELKRRGVTTIFGYPGGQIMPFYDALYQCGLEHVLCRHEQGAVMAAIGYARASKKVGVCIATSGPGATNLITGLADALIDSIPIIAISGQVPNPLIGTDAFQEVDMLGLSIACTKHSFLVEEIDQLPDILEQAFYIAISGRPGPVLIDLPKDIQLAEISQIISATTCQYQLPEPSEIQLRTANGLLAQAAKPILYVGGGVGMAHAEESLNQFIRETGIPVTTTLKGLGAAEHTHPYYLGLLGMHGAKVANLAVQESDLLIAIGVRFDDRVTGKLNTFASQAKVIHIDIDQAEIGKLKQPHVALLGNINTILPTLTQSLNIKNWQQHLLILKEKYAHHYLDQQTSIYAPLLLKQLSQMKSEKTVITTDVGQHQMWAAQHMQFTHPTHFISSSGLGTMGFGLPAAIGAQLARPRDTVICISGDGSFMMNVQELTTIKRKQLPIKIVLIDNQRLGMVRQWQELFFNQRYSETDLSDNPDFLVLASAFDIEGASISRQEQVLPALKIMLASSGAYLLHISINMLENVWPLVPPGESNENMLEAARG